MVKLTFKCDNCGKRFFFKDYESLKNPHKHDKNKKFLKHCIACSVYLRAKEEQRIENLEKSRQKKLDKKSESKKLADKELLEKLEEERMKKKEKVSKDPKKDKAHVELIANRLMEKDIILNKEDVENDNLVEKKEDLEKKAEKLSKTAEKVLYVSADVKRIKVVEWMNSKKRVALNKEREIRQTHAGGWSQEKFQRFVKAKKGKADEWILETISRKGVLRGPYDEIIIDAKDEDIKAFLEDLLIPKE